jgi:RNA polymerase sigma-70 factor (ECF subfamily)
VEKPRESRREATGAEKPREFSREYGRPETGDPGPFADIVEAYMGRIFTHTLRILGHRQDAEDATQETFVRVYRNLDRYDRARPFRSWIYAIATNTALNALRSRTRKGGAAPLSEATTGRDGTNPRRNAVRSELADRLAEAVETLPGTSAALVHLHYTEGMSIREAAEIVGTTEGAAKTALCRARKQLRRQLIGEELP